MRSITQPFAGSSRGTTPMYAGGTNTIHNNGKSNGNGNDSSIRKISAILAVVASGVCFDRMGIPRTDGTEENDGGDGFSSSILGPTGSGEPRAATMTRRRDTNTSLRIRFGNSVVLDHVETSSSRTVAGTNEEDENILLVLPEDEETISPFLYYLMSQMQLVRIDEDNQCLYNLPVGLPGIACKHCNSWNGKKTRCQVFPVSRRTLPAKVRKGLYNHVRRCERCPPEVKLELERLKKLERGTKISREERLFFKKLWFRMGHKAEL